MGLCGGVVGSVVVGVGWWVVGGGRWVLVLVWGGVDVGVYVCVVGVGWWVLGVLGWWVVVFLGVGHHRSRGATLACSRGHAVVFSLGVCGKGQKKFQLLIFGSI